MHILKEFMLYKWASDGITHKQIKEFIKNSKDKSNTSLNKQAENLLQTGLEFFTETLPIWSIVGPTIAGGVLYAATHPDTIRERDREKRLKVLDSAINLVKLQNQKKKKKELKFSSRFDVI